MNEPHPVKLDLPDADVTFVPVLFEKNDADRLFKNLLAGTAWREEHIKLYGRTTPVPRLTAWYGGEGTGYTYSGISNTPTPWTETLLEIRAAAERAANATFNSVLLNRYRTGQDSVSWHSDDEKEFGANPVIASVSLGVTRRFQLRHKTRKDLRTALDLTHGSLIIMRGETQHHWVHQVPKTAKEVGERINLTFRLVRATESKLSRDIKQELTSVLGVAGRQLKVQTNGIRQFLEGMLGRHGERMTDKQRLQLEGKIATLRREANEPNLLELASLDAEARAAPSDANGGGDFATDETGATPGGSAAEKRRGT